MIGKIIIGVLSWIIFDELFYRKGDNDNEPISENSSDSTNRNHVNGSRADHKENNRPGDLDADNQKPVNDQGDRENEQNIHTGKSSEIVGGSSDGGGGKLQSIETDDKTAVVTDQPEAGTDKKTDGGDKEDDIQDDHKNSGSDDRSYVYSESSIGNDTADQADLEG